MHDLSICASQLTHTLVSQTHAPCMLCRPAHGPQDTRWEKAAASLRNWLDAI